MKSEICEDCGREFHGSRLHTKGAAVLISEMFSEEWVWVCWECIRAAKLELAKARNEEAREQEGRDAHYEGRA